jgi:hypothetical protein
MIYIILSVIYAIWVAILEIDPLINDLKAIAALDLNTTQFPE